MELLRSPFVLWFTPCATLETSSFVFDINFDSFEEAFPAKDEIFSFADGFKSSSLGLLFEHGLQKAGDGVFVAAMGPKRASS